MSHDTFDQLRTQITVAFAGTRPSTAEDLADLPVPEEGEDRHIELELQGRAWTDLDAEFWAHHCWSFGALLPASYRYYLPSLLLATLDILDEGGLLIGGALSVLTPSFRRLLDMGTDRRFGYQTSLFTPDQQAAVCSFLGVLMAQPERRFRAAKALKFGWNRLDHPALNACRAFYDRLQHYTQPPIEDAEQRQLIETIRTAFSDRAYPGDDRLCGSDYGDEPAEYALEFRGLDWRTLHPELLAYHYPALSFFTAEAFAYFLPAFMIADVLGERGNADPVFHLTHGLYDEPTVDLASLNPSVLQASGLTSNETEWLQTSLQKRDTVDWHAYALKRFAGFNPRERQAIVRYLDYRAAHAWEFVAVSITAALNSYWRSSPDSG